MASAATAVARAAWQGAAELIASVCRESKTPVVFAVSNCHCCIVAGFFEPERVVIPVKGASKVGDQPIYHGRLYIVGGRLDLRPCDKNEIYLVVADLPIEDALHEYASIYNMTADAPVYIRFNGHELSCKAELPERYAGLVEVNRAQARETAIPSSCR